MINKIRQQLQHYFLLQTVGFRMCIRIPYCNEYGKGIYNVMTERFKYDKKFT